MQHCVWIATAPISFPYLAAFKCPLDGLDHGTSVGQLGTELLLGIFCVAELVQLGVIVEANASAGAGIAVVLPQLTQLCIQSVLDNNRLHTTH